MRGMLHLIVEQVVGLMCCFLFLQKEEIKPRFRLARDLHKELEMAVVGSSISGMLSARVPCTYIMGQLRIFAAIK